MEVVMKRWILPTVLAVGATVGCGNPLVVGPLESGAPGTATISGGLDDVFAGETAEFQVNPPSVSSLPSLRVSMKGRSEEGGVQQLTIVARGQDRLAPGVYELSHFDVHDPAAEGILIAHSYRAGSHMWTSTRGTLEIRASSEELLEGRFHFEAHNCTPSMIHCGNRPPVEISGAFSAEAGLFPPTRGTVEGAIAEGFLSGPGELRIGATHSIDYEGGRFVVYVDGTNEYGEPRSLFLVAHGTRRLEVGRYELEDFEVLDPAVTGIAMLYGASRHSVTDDDGWIVSHVHWTSFRGVLEVLTSTLDRFEARFEFEGHSCDFTGRHCDPVPSSIYAEGFLAAEPGRGDGLE
jgi:hypothetical protein